MSNRFAIFYNPSSANNRALQYRDEIETKLHTYKLDYQIFVSGSEKHFFQLLEENAGKFDVLVSAGGDSTLLMLLRGLRLLKSTATVGMIGIGSSNDIMRHFNIVSLDGAIAALAQGKKKKIDLIRIKNGEIDELALGQINVGLGAEVNRLVAQKKGTLLYRWGGQTLSGLISIWQCYRRKKLPMNLMLEMDGEVLQGDWDIFIASKIRYWASGRLFCPHAISNDGLLHTVLIPAQGFLGMLKLSMKSERGKHIQQNGVLTHSCRKIILRSQRPFQLQADGDLIVHKGKIYTTREVELSVLYRQVEFLLPR